MSCPLDSCRAYPDINAPQPGCTGKKVGGGIAIVVTALAIAAILLIVFLPHVALIASATALVGKGAAIAIFAVIGTIAAVIAVALLKKPCHAENNHISLLSTDPNQGL